MRSRDKLNALYLHLKKAHGHQTSQGADLSREAPTPEATRASDIIVKFTTFRHRTIVYRLEKNKKDNIKVHVDLTKKRHSLLKSASNLVMLIGFYLVTLM